MKTTDEQLDVQIRWLIRRDMPEVLAIESASFAEPWTDDDFLSCLRQRNCIGMVEESWGVIRGYMIYELNKGTLEILNFAVKPDVRLRGVGRQMIQRLKSKLSQQRRRMLTTLVRESNLDAQLFFKACGFLAESILPEHYDNGEAAYLFRYTRPLDDLL